jgi:hypothetical protein
MFHIYTVAVLCLAVTAESFYAASALAEPTCSARSHLMGSSSSTATRHCSSLSMSAAPSTAAPSTSKSLTQRIMEGIPSEQQAGGAGAATTYEALLRVDGGWEMLRSMKTGADAGPAPQFVKESNELLATAPAYDVVICGGTLGIFMATALQLKGWSVAVVERGALAGRQQEWNISEQGNKIGKLSRHVQIYSVLESSCVHYY